MEKGKQNIRRKVPQKTRYSRETVLDEKSEQDIDGELDGNEVADERHSCNEIRISQ